MAFIQIERGHRIASRALINTVRISKSGAKGKKAYQVCIHVSSDVYKRVGSPNFFHVMLGSKEHSGFMALIPKNMQTTASYKVTPPPHGKGSVKIGLSGAKIGIIANNLSQATDLPFEITEDGLIVDLRGIRPAVRLGDEIGHRANSETMLAAE